MQTKELLKEKLDQTQRLMTALELDLWLIFVRESATLPDPSLDLVVGTNVTWQSAFLVPAHGEPLALVGSLDAANVRDSTAFAQVEGYLEGIGAPLRAAVERLRPAGIAINYSLDSEMADGLTHGMFLRLQEIFSSTPYAGRLVSSEPLISALRGRKTPAEIERMRRAVAVTLEILDAAGRFIRAGRTEQEVASFILDDVRRRGLELAWDAAHCPAVFSGPDTAGAHAAPTERVIEPGHVLNIDFGVRVEGYCSDLQRTFYVPHPGETTVPAAVRAGLQTIVEAIDAAAAALRPGVTGHVVDAAARDHIVAAGYPEYPHALGHQIGRQAHDGVGLLCPEWERYGQRPYMKIEEGQVYTLEPRLPIAGHGIATIEEMVQVGPEGPTYLGPRQREVLIAG